MVRASFRFSAKIRRTSGFWLLIFIGLFLVLLTSYHVRGHRATIKMPKPQSNVESRARAVYEKVWPQGQEVRHPVAPQLLARLEAAPPEVSRQMATVFRKPLVWRAGKSASFSGLSSFDCFVATLPPRLRAKFQRPFSDQDEYAASTSFSFSASAQPPAEASIPDEEDAFASVGVPFQ